MSGQRSRASKASPRHWLDLSVVDGAGGVLGVRLDQVESASSVDRYADQVNVQTSSGAVIRLRGDAAKILMAALEGRDTGTGAAAAGTRLREARPPAPPPNPPTMIAEG